MNIVLEWHSPAYKWLSGEEARGEKEKGNGELRSPSSVGVHNGSQAIIRILYWDFGERHFMQDYIFK